MPPTKPISIRASKRWRSLEDELDADLEVRLGGHLHVAESEAEADAIRQRAKGDAVGGVAIELVAGAQLRNIAPTLTQHALLGAYTSGDGQAHPGRTAIAFANAARRLGASTVFGDSVVPVIEGGRAIGVQFGDGTVLGAATVVLAAGAWSCAILERVGLALPLRWRGLTMLLSEVSDVSLAPTVTAVGRNLSLKRVPSGQMMVGGRWLGAQPADRVDTAPVPANIDRQWQAAVAIVPGMAPLAIAQSWAGVEAQSINSLPFIGPSPIAGFYLATGFSNHGFQISPIVGELVAAEITSGEQALLAPFRPERANGVSSAAIATFRDEPATT